MSDCPVVSGYVKVKAVDVYERLRATYDLYHEHACHTFALRVQKFLEQPEVTGILWWRKERKRTVEEAWRRAEYGDYADEYFLGVDYYIRSETADRMLHLLKAARDNPGSDMYINADVYAHTVKPWRDNQKLKEGE